MILADPELASEAGLQGLEDRGTAACVALGDEDKQRAIRSDLPATRRMAQWLRTPEGRAHYRRRKTIPEPVFGWIKQVLGFRSFSLRGITAVSAEWAAHMYRDELKAHASTRMDARMSIYPWPLILNSSLVVLAVH